MDKNVIIEKVKNKTPMTPEEELFYLTEVANIPKNEAVTIIKIASNKDKNKLID